MSEERAKYGPPSVGTGSDAGPAVSGNWLAAIGGALTGTVIATVQRMYPDISFIAVLGVGLGCGALFNVVMFATQGRKKR